MRALGFLARIGVAALVLVLLTETMAFDGWSETSQPPTTSSFAIAILDDWNMMTVVLGLLLSMAMIGASYLVRDERLANLTWDLGQDVETPEIGLPPAASRPLSSKGFTDANGGEEE
ncbi:MAG: hypothetical protein CMB75_01105 [Euryarchaeota archaeon]|nr:hypothetical protein [Euryarchaeota archaeon]|tara:strand:- start:14479 stop:14829 length:351 start_codon:yes stop_codon:yes gene_type:complete